MFLIHMFTILNEAFLSMLSLEWYSSPKAATFASVTAWGSGLGLKLVSFGHSLRQIAVLTP